jgi:hypothetical protein
MRAKARFPVILFSLSLLAAEWQQHSNGREGLIRSREEIATVLRQLGDANGMRVSEENRA